MSQVAENLELQQHTLSSLVRREIEGDAPTNDLTSAVSDKRGDKGTAIASENILEA